MQRLRVPVAVADLIRGLHPELKRKVRTALWAILQDPFAGKALKDELAELRSFRVGRLRVIYRRATDGVIEIVAIGPRQRIYEETYRLIRKER